MARITLRAQERGWTDRPLMEPFMVALLEPNVGVAATAKLQDDALLCDDGTLLYYDPRCEGHVRSGSARTVVVP